MPPSMPTFFPGFDIPPPPSFPGFPDIQTPNPVFPDPVLVSEPLNLFDSVFTHHSTGMPQGEEPLLHFDTLGGSHHQRHRRPHPPGSTYPSRRTPDGPSRQSSRNSSRQNSDASYPHSIWEHNFRTVVNGREAMYNARGDADGNVHEYIKEPGKNDKYVINGMPQEYLPAASGTRAEHVFVEELRDSRRQDRSRETNDRKQHRDPSRRPPDGRHHPGGSYPVAPAPSLSRSPYEQSLPTGPGIPSFYPSAPPYPSQPGMPPPQCHPMLPNGKYS